MELRLRSDLEARLSRIAAEQGRNPEELAQEAVARYCDEESRFVEAVRIGEDALDRGESLTHEEVGHRLERFLKP